MAKANLSRMNVESLMDLRDRVDQRRVSIAAKKIGSLWRAGGAQRAPRRKRIEREEGCPEIS
jgi:hypothetical protein